MATPRWSWDDFLGGIATGGARGLSLGGDIYNAGENRRLRRAETVLEHPELLASARRGRSRFGLDSDVIGGGGAAAQDMGMNLGLPYGAVDAEVATGEPGQERRLAQAQDIIEKGGFTSDVYGRMAERSKEARRVEVERRDLGVTLDAYYKASETTRELEQNILMFETQIDQLTAGGRVEEAKGLEQRLAALNAQFDETRQAAMYHGGNLRRGWKITDQEFMLMKQRPESYGEIREEIIGRRFGTGRPSRNVGGITRPRP